MIRIHKQSTAPEPLLTKGKEKTEELCSAFSRNPDDFSSGNEKCPIEKTIYGHRAVKEALSAAQYGKCCYCESKIMHVDYGDIEHYRPKGCYQQERRAAVHYPGYYWLAYEWDNLLYSCTRCNRENKKNWFPLGDDASRAKGHQDDISLEKPLIINPAFEDPSEHIAFREEYAFPVNDSIKGRVTIEAVGLNRESLIEKRRSWMDTLNVLQDAVRSLAGTPKADEIQIFLTKCLQNEGEFAAMSRACLSDAST